MVIGGCQFFGSICFKLCFFQVSAEVQIEDGRSYKRSVGSITLKFRFQNLYSLVNNTGDKSCWVT